MEYLMTYGWAILVIAIILAALFSLGVFNTSNLSVRAQPGSCAVFRPGGAMSDTNIAFGGVCANYLPEFVFRSRGVGDYMIVPGSNLTSSPLNIQNNATITAWIYVSGSPYHDIFDKENQYGLKLDYNNQPHSCYPSNYIGLCLEWDTINDWVGPGYAIPNASFNQWIFVGASIAYDSSTGNSIKRWFANGQEIGNSVVSGRLTYANSIVTIGAISPGYTGYGEAEWFNGSIANVQIYNASLPQSLIKSMYLSGIGGDPIQIQNLVGWWPLNGNADDESGNLNNAQNVNVIYGSSWINNYQIT
jgi:hypothetical protein